MTGAEYKELAKSYGADTYGDIASESGWGICFAFDLADALYTFLSENYDGQWSEEYAALCALGSAPIKYNPGMGQGRPEEGSTGEMILSDMEGGEDWKPFFSALEWFSSNF